MIIHIFLLTLGQLGPGLQVFYYPPNVSVFVFQMADLEFYFLVNDFSVITCWSPNEDHLLIVFSFGLIFASPNVMLSLCRFLILSLFLPSYPPFPHFCWLRWSHFLLSFTFFLSASLPSSPFPQYHRDLEMSLSLSASQKQAVMLALNKPLCECVCLCGEKRTEEQLGSVGWLQNNNYILLYT